MRISEKKKESLKKILCDLGSLDVEIILIGLTKKKTQISIFHPPNPHPFPPLKLTETTEKHVSPYFFVVVSKWLVVSNFVPTANLFFLIRDKLIQSFT